MGLALNYGGRFRSPLPRIPEPSQASSSHACINFCSVSSSSPPFSIAMAKCFKFLYHVVGSGVIKRVLNSALCYLATSNHIISKFPDICRQDLAPRILSLLLIMLKKCEHFKYGLGLICQIVSKELPEAFISPFLNSKMAFTGMICTSSL